MTGRHRLAAAAALAMLALSVCASNVDAQSLPQSPESGIGAFLADPSKWVTDVFNSALVGLGKSTTDEMRDSLSGLGVVTVWSGINLIVHPHVRAPYHGALELIPRVLVGALLVNTSLNWGRFTIDANNALCQALGVAALPGWSELSSGNASGLLMTLIGFLIYLVMGALLLGQMLMRLALVDALLVISPIALLCWVVPQTYGWARF